MNRNDILSTAGETLAYAEDYLDTRIDLLKLNAAEKVAESGAKLLAISLVAVVVLLSLGCLTIALSLWIGYLLGSTPLGFLLVGIGYTILAALLFIFRKPLLRKPLLRVLITQLFKN